MTLDRRQYYRRLFFFKKERLCLNCGKNLNYASSTSTINNIVLEYKWCETCKKKDIIKKYHKLH